MTIRKVATLTFLVLLLACCAFAGNTITVSGSNIQSDSFGTKLIKGSICFQPVTNAGVPIAYQVGGGGQVISQPSCTGVVNGAFTTTLPDVSHTNPQNVCFNVTVKNGSTGQTVLGALPGSAAQSGYQCVQPIANQSPWCGASVCNLDSYTPNLSALVVQVAGPTGPQGPPGAGSITGLTSDGASGISVSGGASLGGPICSVVNLQVDVRCNNGAHGAAHVDGVTDDSGAIQDAIDIAGTNGKAVYMPRGSYNIAHQLHYRTTGNVAAIKIYGDGSRLTKLLVPTGFSDPSVLDIVGVQSLSFISQFQWQGYIRDFEISPASTLSAVVHGLTIQGLWHSKISGLYIHDLTGDGINLPTSYAIATDPDWWASGDLRIEQNFISGNGGWGINIASGQAVSGAIIEHNRIGANALGGVRNTGWTNTIAHNSIFSNGCNKGAVLSSGCTTNPAGSGIVLDRPDTLYGGGTTQCEIVDNELDSNFAAHIRVIDNSGCSIHGNRFISHSTIWTNPEGLGANVPRISIAMGGRNRAAKALPIYNNIQRSDSAGAVSGFAPAGGVLNPWSDGEVASAALMDANAGLVSIFDNLMGPIGEYNNSANEILAAAGAGAYGVLTTSGGALTGVTMKNTGNGYTVSPTVIIAGGDTNTAVATGTAVVSGGQVTGVTVSGGGTAYNHAPLVGFFDTLGKGSGAAGTAVLDGSGHVASVTITNNGSGYTDASHTVVSFSSQCATQPGVAIAATIGVADIDITAGGSGYTSSNPPSVIISDTGGGTGAAASAVIDDSIGQIVAINITGKGIGYVSPTISFSGGVGTGATATASTGRTLGSATISTAGSGCLGPLRMLILPEPYPFTNTAWNKIVDRNIPVSLPGSNLGNVQLDSPGTTNITSTGTSTLNLKGGPLNTSGHPGLGSAAGLDTYIYKTQDDSGNFKRLHVGANGASSTFSLLVEQGGTESAQGMNIGTTGSGALSFMTNNVNKLLIDTSGNLIPSSLGVGSSQIGTVNFPLWKICIGNTAGTNTMCDAAPSFTGNRVRTWQDSSGTVPFLEIAQSWASGAKQTFQASASTAGLRFAGISSAPSSLVEGDAWYNTTDHHLYLQNGTAAKQVLFNGDVTAVNVISSAPGYITVPTLPGSVTAGAPVGSNTQVRGHIFVPSQPITLSKAAFEVTTLSASATQSCYVGIYSADGTTQLGRFTIDVSTGTSNGKSVALDAGGTLSLAQGTAYAMSISCTDAVVQFRGYSAPGSTSSASAFNQFATRIFFIAGNAATAGVPPASLGTLTTQSQNVIPLMVLGN